VLYPKIKQDIQQNTLRLNININDDGDSEIFMIFGERNNQKII